jgi:hypothetical protein
MRGLWAVLLLGAFAPGAAQAWENMWTHPTLTELSVNRQNKGDALSIRLRDLYGLDAGLNEPLECHLGFPRFAAPDAEVADGRFTETKGLGADDPPEWVGLPECEEGPTPTEISPRHALSAGVYAEDNPNQRARHHFHDPVFEHPPPAGNRGMDDDRLVGVLDDMISEAITCTRGGDLERCIKGIQYFPLPWLHHLYRDEDGNFSGRGRSARDRAFNLPLGIDEPSEEDPKSLFSLMDAEAYGYWALAAETDEERQHAAILHLLALGGVLHLLQDQSSPGHVRNDFYIEHAWGARPWNHDNIEDRGAATRPLQIINTLAYSGNLLSSIPQAYLEHVHDLYAVPLFDPNDYSPTLPSGSASAEELEGFFDSREGGAGGGLAEIVNTRFLSRGRTDNTYYSSPNLEPDACANASFLPLRTLDEPYNPAAITEPPDLGLFVTSPLVPHLGHCRFFSAALSLLGFPQHAPLQLSVIEESVQRDYMELLFPLAVDYTQTFIDRYYAPRLEVVPLEPGDADSDRKFKLKNPNQLQLTISKSSIEVIYETLEGERRRVQIGCQGLDGNFLIPPGATNDTVCSLPESIPLADRAANRGDFWVVARGQLGALGEIGTYAEYDAGKEFVAAIAHVRGDQIVYGGGKNDYMANLASESGRDQFTQFDVFTTEIDPLHPETTRSPRQNLTKALRLGSSTDFVHPKPEPEGEVIAVRTDIIPGVIPQEYAQIAPDGRFSVVKLLEPDGDGGFELSDVEICPLTEACFPSWGSVYAGHDMNIEFSPDRESLFLYESFTSPGSSRLWRVDRDSGSAVDVGGVLLDHESYGAPQAPDVGQEFEICHATEWGHFAVLNADQIVRPVNCARSVVTDIIGPEDDDYAAEELFSGTDLFAVNIGAPLPDSWVTHPIPYARIDVDESAIVSCSPSSVCGEASDDQIEMSPIASPDGKKLLFMRTPKDDFTDTLVEDWGSELFVADFTGTGAVELRKLVELSPPHRIVNPTWSPGGDWIAFNMIDYPNSENYTGEIFVVSAYAETPQVPVQVTKGIYVANKMSWRRTNPLLLPGADD